MPCPWAPTDGQGMCDRKQRYWILSVEPLRETAKEVRLAPHALICTGFAQTRSLPIVPDAPIDWKHATGGLDVLILTRATPPG